MAVPLTKRFWFVQIASQASIFLHRRQGVTLFNTCILNGGESDELSLAVFRAVAACEASLCGS
eukprot:1157153-Pelagomonas_calceolata.AAC.10